MRIQFSTYCGQFVEDSFASTIRMLLKCCKIGIQCIVSIIKRVFISGHSSSLNLKDLLQFALKDLKDFDLLTTNISTFISITKPNLSENLTTPLKTN